MVSYLTGTMFYAMYASIYNIIFVELAMKSLLFLEITYHILILIALESLTLSECNETNRNLEITTKKIIIQHTKNRYEQNDWNGNTFPTFSSIKFWYL